MSTLTTAAAVRRVLTDALAADPNVLWVTESRVGPLGQLAPIEAEHPDQVMVTPVADGAAVALAVGLAAGGRRPVVELADGGRIGPVVTALADAARLGTADVRAPVVVRMPYGRQAAGIDPPIGPWLDALDGVTVVCGSDPRTAAGLLRAALRASGPTLVIEPRALARIRGEVDDASVAAEARIVRTGAHVTITAHGTGVAAALDAADALAAQGIAAEVVDLVALAPLDATTVGASVRRTGRLVVAHDADPALASRVRAAALEAAFLYLEAPLAAAPADVAALVDAARGAVEY